ncbi:hypothetical protein [uncultured Cohaesibacter sp.]|uniref:hypothetical protein n=1 Tax=uncultured Cohaesibacter sp. TaxID=1002546 RepID=UPI002AAC014E|nr:hypothetical protein [uncultured Cohaesibacter sp.]
MIQFLTQLELLKKADLRPVFKAIFGNHPEGAKGSKYTLGLGGEAFFSTYLLIRRKYETVAPKQAA